EHVDRVVDQRRDVHPAYRPQRDPLPRARLGLRGNDRRVEQDVARVTHGAQASACGAGAGYQSLVTTRTMPAGVGGSPAYRGSTWSICGNSRASSVAPAWRAAPPGV